MRKEIAPIEKIAKTQKVIYFDNDKIEVPNIVIFRKENSGLIKSFAQRVMNPGVPQVEVSESDFNTRIMALETEIDGVIYIELKGLKTTARVNLDLIKRDAVYVERDDQYLKVNDIVFTSDIVEYHGFSMANNGVNVFQVKPEQLEELTKIFLD